MKNWFFPSGMLAEEEGQQGAFSELADFHPTIWLLSLHLVKLNILGSVLKNKTKQKTGEGSVHCGWYHPRAGGPGFYKEAG